MKSSPYIEGFCKAAEAAGVDPNVLIKQALIPMSFLPKNIPSSISLP